MVSYPTSLDSLSNPTAGLKTNDATVPHATQHANANDILEQLEAKVGISEASAQDSPVADAVLGSSTNGKSKWRKIVSADITDGTIATADLAANAASQSGIAVGSSGTITTTSATAVNMTDMAVTLTTVGGELRCWFEGTFTHSASGVVFFSISLDGAAGVDQKAIVIASGGQNGGTLARFTGVAAGSHTVRVVWGTTSGTATVNNNERYLLVEEAKR